MIQVLGWYGHTNVGDESYKIAFPKLAPEKSFDFAENLSANRYDSLIVGGGDILSHPFLEKAKRVQADRKLIISASANKNTPIHLLRQFSQIFIRDRYSYDFLTNRGISCRYMPDISFFLKPSPEKGYFYVDAAFKSERLELKKKRIGVIINSYLSDCGTDSALARDFLVFHQAAYDLARIFDATDASIVFIPMCTNLPTDDRITNGIVANRCKFWKKNMMVFDRLDVQETLNLIASMDLVISSRLHSTIFSFISGVPFFDITHHDKNGNFLKTIGLEKFGMSYWDFSSKRLSGHINSVLNNAEPYKTEIGVAYQKQIEIFQREVSNVSICEPKQNY